MTEQGKGLDKYRGTTEYFIVFSQLINAARHRGTVTYQEIALEMGLPASGNHMQREVGLVLGAISEDEVRRNRPMLSAVAVSAKQKPSEGFFSLAKDLGLLGSDGPDEKERFWQDTKEKLYGVWHRNLSSMKGIG